MVSLAFQKVEMTKIVVGLLTSFCILIGILLGAMMWITSTKVLLALMFFSHCYVGVVAFSWPWVSNEKWIPKDVVKFAVATSIFGIGAVLPGNYFYKQGAVVK